MSLLLDGLAKEVKLAHDRGDSFHAILADVVTVMAMLIVSASRELPVRMIYVRKSMERLAEFMRKEQ